MARHSKKGRLLSGSVGIAVAVLAGGQIMETGHLSAPAPTKSISVQDVVDLMLNPGPHSVQIAEGCIDCTNCTNCSVCSDCGNR